MAALAFQAFDLALVGLQGGAKLVQFQRVLPGVGLIADMNERFDMCLKLSSPYFALPEANPRFAQRVLASGDGGGAMLQFFAQFFSLFAHLNEWVVRPQPAAQAEETCFHAFYELVQRHRLALSGRPYTYSPVRPRYCTRRSELFFRLHLFHKLKNMSDTIA